MQSLPKTENAAHKPNKRFAICEIALGRARRKAQAFALTYLSAGNLSPNWEKVVWELLLDGNEQYHKANYNGAKNIFERSLAIAKEKLDPSHVLFADIYTNLSVLESVFGRHENTLEYRKTAFEIRRRHYGRLHYTHIQSHLNIGSVLRTLGKHTLASKHFRLALQQAELMQQSLNKLGRTISKTPKRPHSHSKTKVLLGLRTTINTISMEKAGIHFHVANDLKDSGDFDGAIAHYKQSLNIWEQNQVENSQYLAACHNNMALCHKELEQYAQALGYYEKSLEVWKVRGDSVKMARMYSNIGGCYTSLQKHEKAFAAYQKSLDLWGNRHGQFKRSYASLLHQLGQHHYHTGNAGKALQHHFDALKMRIGLFGEKHPDICRQHLHIAGCHLLAGNADLALQSCQKAVCSLYFEANPSDVRQPPPIRGASSPIRLLDCLKSKAELFWLLFERQGNGEDLTAALRHYEQAIRLIAEISNTYDAELSKSSFRKKVHTIFDRAIHTAIAASLSSCSLVKKAFPQAGALAFSFCEKGKAALLLSQLRTRRAQLLVDIPQKLVNYERKLLNGINENRLKLQREQSRGKHRNIGRMQQLEAEVFELNQKRKRLAEHIKQTQPEYYKLVLDSESCTPRQVCAHLKSLPQLTAVLQFFEGENEIYLFAMAWVGGKAHFTAHTIAKPPDFEKLLSNFSRCMRLNVSALIGKLVEASNRLSDLLLAPARPLIAQCEKLVVVPDGKLFSLSFDLLFLQTAEKNVGSFRDLPFLVKTHAIACQHSSSLLLHTAAREAAGAANPSFKKNGLLGVAPVRFDWGGSLPQDPGIPPDTGKAPPPELPESEAEIVAAAELFAQNGLVCKTLLHRCATPENLMKHARHYDYLLIATHGFADPKDKTLSGIMLAPSPAFGDGRFHLQQTYNLRLNAKLVVLSSCQSGMGSLSRGEGMIALNRGFLYAGASSVVYTLFNVNDHSARKIILSFFGEILPDSLRQPDFGKALQAAKLRLLNENAAPFHWAGFTLMGG